MNWQRVTFTEVPTEAAEHQKTIFASNGSANRTCENVEFRDFSLQADQEVCSENVHGTV